MRLNKFVVFKEKKKLTINKVDIINIKNVDGFCMLKKEKKKNIGKKK